MCTRGAFTMVELIAVILVTAILAVLTVPSLASLASAGSAGAGHAIAADAAFARERAVNTGARTWVDVDVATNSYWLLEEPEGGAGFADAGAIASPLTGRPMGRSLASGEFSGVSIVSASFDGATRVGFDWVGSPVTEALESLSEDGRIVLTGGTAVVIDRNSGFIGVVTP